MAFTVSSHQKHSSLVQSRRWLSVAVFLVPIFIIIIEREGLLVNAFFTTSTSVVPATKSVISRKTTTPPGGVGRSGTRIIISKLGATPAGAGGRSNNSDRQQTLETLREQQTRLALITAELGLNNRQGSAPLQEAFVVGQTKLEVPSQSGIRTDRFRTCVVLTPNPITKDQLQQQQQTNYERQQRQQQQQQQTQPGLLLPLTSPAQLKLLSFAKASRPLSKSVLLGLNTLLVNRDGALFDNLPWSQWSVDPQQRNYDAAGNPINSKFHLGKRDAYNRLMGKDWQGRSVSIGNMALRLKYLLEATDEENHQEGNDDDGGGGGGGATTTTNLDPLDDDGSGSSSRSKISLAQRILELQIRELEMDLAEFDWRLAIARNNQPTEVDIIERERQIFEDQLTECQRNLQSLLLEEEEETKLQEEPSSLIIDILDKVADWTTDYGKNQAPYRGAMGYAPMLDTEEDIEGSVLPYTSPYDVLKEIIDDQLNAEVIGAVLENTSLLKGTLALGGALVLRRKTAKKTITLAGEQLEINDEEEDFGNIGGQGGEIKLVECDADEALAMGITCGVPIHLEPGILDRAGIMVEPAKISDEEAFRRRRNPASVSYALPPWKPRDPELSLLVEGQGQDDATTERASPLRIPRTTTSLFDSIFESSPSDAPSGMFPTDNPVQSLNQYDDFNNEDKARTLMTMSNFGGKLPRPRVLRKEERSRRGTNTLDDLLLPLIDESVRRQFLMRDAEMRGDMETLEQLRNEKTKRQVAKEKAELARERGEEDVAEWWDAEAELYGDLRADVTQDEGSYSRFLDRDEWYERTRKAQAKKLDKKKFGTLLDGIE